MGFLASNRVSLSVPATKSESPASIGRNEKVYAKPFGTRPLHEVWSEPGVSVPNQQQITAFTGAIALLLLAQILAYILR
jgi:hypothetical protein